MHVNDDDPDGRQRKQLSVTRVYNIDQIVRMSWMAPYREGVAQLCLL